MILSGRLYTAEQLQRASLVDMVVEDGAGEAAIEQVVHGGRIRACAARLAALEARRLAAPITYESLHDDRRTLGRPARCRLTDRDLRLMERLARAQVRKAGGAEEGAVEEIKRIELDTAWGDERTGAHRMERP